MTNLILKPNGKIASQSGKPINMSLEDWIACCCDPIAYKLSDCNIVCGNTDCDGDEADIITTPTLSNLVPSDIGKVVKISGSISCWEVSEWSSITGAVAVSVTARYDGGCPACCDPCYACGDCEFHPDSTLTVEAYVLGCTYSDEDCNTFTTGSMITPTADKYIMTNGPRVTGSPCATWTGGTHYFYEPIPDCSVPSSGHVSSESFSVSYNCSTNQWSLRPSVPSVENCDGSTWDWELCENMSPSGSLYTRRWGSITLSNNNCGAPGPGL